MSRELVIKTGTLGAKRHNVVAFYVAGEASPKGEGADVWAATGLDWESVSATARFEGRRGQMLDIVAPPKIETPRLLALGSGRPAEDEPFSPTAWADRGGSLGGKLMAARVDEVSVLLDGDDATPEAVAEFAAGLRLRHYRFDKYRKQDHGDDDGQEPGKLTVTLHVHEKAAIDKAIADRMATVEGTLLARDLVNEPPNELGPLEFADITSKFGELGIEIEILTPERDGKARHGRPAGRGAGLGAPGAAGGHAVAWRQEGRSRPSPLSARVSASIRAASRSSRPSTWRT